MHLFIDFEQLILGHFIIFSKLFSFFQIFCFNIISEVCYSKNHK